EEILRQSIFRLIPTDGNTAGASGDVVESLAGREVEAIHCDGTRLSVRLRIAQIKFDNEARFRFFFEELTGEQRQQELQNENQLLRTVLDSTGLAVARLSPH